MGENDPIPVDPDFAGDIRRWIGRHWHVKPLHVAGMLWVAVLLLSPNANAQAVRFDTDVTTVSAQCVAGKQCPVLSLPGTIVSVCGGSVSTLASCLAAPATTYTDFSAGTPCPTTAQLTPSTGGACLSTADAEGNAGFWALPGQYNYFLRVPATAGGGTYGPYPINVGASAGCPLGATCDASFSTLPLACTAAGTGTLYLTRTWSGLTTQTLACNIYALANGIIKAAPGQVVTLSKSFQGTLTQHVDTSSGGTVAFTGTVDAFYPEWFGGKGDYSGSGTDNCPALTALAAIGGKIYFSAGHYYSSCAFVTAIPSQLSGAGTGVNVASAAKTSLVFAAGVSGITFQLGTRGSSVNNLWIHSLDTGSNSDHGIEIGDSRISITNNVIDKFGGDGIYCAATDPCDNQYVNHNYLLSNFAAGWHCSTTADCNVSWIGNNTAQLNGTYGFYQQSGATNSFINDDTASNGTADFDIAGNSHYIENPYCEGAGIFNLRSTQSKVESPNGGGCTFKNQGGPSNVIVEVHDYFDVLLGIGPFIGSSGMPSSPTYYGLRSGSVGVGCIDLHDDTNNAAIFHYCPSTSTITFDKAVSFGVAAPFASPVISYKASSSGADSATGTVKLDGQNGSSAEVSYGAIYATINSNTASAQKGKVRIQTAQSGTLTDVAGFNEDGTWEFREPLTVSALPACNGARVNRFVVVTDNANSPAYLSTVTGGGSTMVIAVCNGSVWQAH